MGYTPSHLGHVNIYVRSAEASRQWYEDILGLHTYDFLAGRAAFMTANLDESHEIALMEIGADAEGPHNGQVGLNHMAWRMDTLADLEDFYNNLHKNGVEIKRVSEPQPVPGHITSKTQTATVSRSTTRPPEASGTARRSSSCTATAPRSTSPDPGKKNSNPME